MEKNLTLPSLFNKKVVYDFYPANDPGQDTVIFIPGFKGFKDWGTWHLVAKNFQEAGFNFIKANLSHNGIDLNQDENELTDLIAFSNNNFSIELHDISLLVGICHEKRHGKSRIILMGHSRGGGLAILAASHDPRIDAVISWASPSDFGDHFFAPEIPIWEKNGVYYIKNNRTGQDLPLRYQLYQDYILNHARLHILTRAKKITQPFLAIHGDQDETVPLSALELIKTHCSHVKSHVVKEANHTFDASHPWTEPLLPTHLNEVVRVSLNFLNQLS